MMLTSSKLQFFTEKVCLTPEFRLVVACSWVPLEEYSKKQTNTIDSLTQCNLNWSEIVSLVQRHGVVGQFCAVMCKVGWINVPSEAKNSLNIIRKQMVMQSLSQAAELTKISRLFNDAGIPLIPLKGVVLSNVLYKDPCIRCSCDLDILVRPEDIERSEEILRHIGYRHGLGFHGMGERQKRHILDTLHHHEYINDITGVHLELHWRSYLWTREQVDLLWDTSVFMNWFGVGIKQLSKEDAILFLVDHGARHGWMSLKWLSDIAMLLQNMSEVERASLFQRALFFDLQRVLCQTTTLLEWFYGIKSQKNSKEHQAEEILIQRLSLYAACQLTATIENLAHQRKWFFGPKQAYRLKKLKPTTPISSLIKNILLIPADFIDFPLPNYLFWLYYPLRPILWFKRNHMNLI